MSGPITPAVSPVAAASAERVGRHRAPLTSVDVPRSPGPSSTSTVSTPTTAPAACGKSNSRAHDSANATSATMRRFSSTGEKSVRTDESSNTVRCLSCGSSASRTVQPPSSDLATTRFPTTARSSSPRSISPPLARMLPLMSQPRASSAGATVSVDDGSRGKPACASTTCAPSGPLATNSKPSSSSVHISNSIQAVPPRTE